MKVLKKLGIFMACAMLVTSVVPGTTNSAKAATETDAENASTALAEKYEEEYAHDSKYKNPLPAFYDINQDGVDEMFIYYEKNSFHTVEIFYYDYSGEYGNVVRAKKITNCDCIQYNEAKKQINVVRSASYTETTDTIYSFTGKKLKKGTSYSLKSSGKKVKYYKNGKQISKKKYTNAMTKFSKWERIDDLLENWY